MLTISVPLTARQQYLVNVYVTLNSAGRKDQFQRGRYRDPQYYSNEAGPLLGQLPSPTELDELEELGLIAIKKNGAITVTDKGRSVRTGSYGIIVP
jgi:hypothetical protein